MPARHTSLRRLLPQGRGLEEWLLSTKEGVGETSGQTAGSSFRGVRSRQSPVRQKKQVFFVRCGSRCGPQFHRSKGSTVRRPQVKSGPDVFADALVPSRSAEKARRLFPTSLKS